MAEETEDQQKDPVAITAITCGPQCVRGEEHSWDGPVVKLENGGTSSCSKCGALAIDVAMWY